MKVEIITHRKIETNDLLEDLKNVANKLNKPPTIAEYNKNGKFESTAYVRRFGSWNNALSRLGMPLNNKQWSEEELLMNMEEAWKCLGKQPSRRDMNNKNVSKISSGAYTRFYKNWSTALNKYALYLNKKNENVAHKFFEPNKCKVPNHKTSRDINLRLRFQVLKRDNFKCCMCGRSPASTPGLELHIDHIIPYSKGGETVIDNLQTLCSDCNLGKSNLE